MFKPKQNQKSQENKINNQLDNTAQDNHDNITDALRDIQHTPSPRAMLQLQRTIGNQALISLMRMNSPVVQRFEVEGPFNKNNPVHEALTLTAIKDALAKIKDKGGKAGGLLKDVKADKLPDKSDKEAHNLEPKNIDPSAQQFIRGVIWPDDPKGYLFDSDEGTTNYSSGTMWYEEFDADEKDEPEELIARSHYGDLQFFHAMASKDGEDPKETKAKILKWSRFLSDVAAGKIDPKTKLSDIPLTKELFTEHLDYTVAKLFNYEKGSNQDIQQRAAGALMHLIQDSHAAGHTGRDEKTGEVSQFRSYENQDHHKHGEKDAWAEGKDLGERIQKTPGAATAVEKCAEVLVMLDQGASTDEVIKYLDEQILKLNDKAEKSGPGGDYKKK